MRPTVADLRVAVSGEWWSGEWSGVEVSRDAESSERSVLRARGLVAGVADGKGTDQGDAGGDGAGGFGVAVGAGGERGRSGGVVGPALLDQRGLRHLVSCRYAERGVGQWRQCLRDFRGRLIAPARLLGEHLVHQLR